MRRYRLWVAMILLVCSQGWRTAPLRAADDPDVPGEVIVKLATMADLPAIAYRYRLDPTPLGQLRSRPIYRLRITDGVAAPDRATELAADRRVVYAEPNFESQAPESRARVSWARGEPAAYAAQWAPAMTGLSAAHAVQRGAGIRVAVLDTGVDRTHPALAGRLLAGYDFIDNDADPSEGGNATQNLAFGHGTHVAGLIALVAPAAQIMPVRVLDANGVSNLWVLAQGLQYAVDPDGNPATADGAQVINLSLSTTRRTRLLADIVGTVSDEIETVGGRPGVVVVAAAGNNGSTTVEYPAGEGVAGSLAVGATTQADTLATFSNRGSWVGITAPGEQIVSTFPGNSYATWSGTSMATPLVAGVAALVRAQQPTLNSREVVDQLIRTAHEIPKPGRPRLDAAAAVTTAIHDQSFAYYLPLVIR